MSEKVPPWMPVRDDDTLIQPWSEPCPDWCSNGSCPWLLTPADPDMYTRYHSHEIGAQRTAVARQEFRRKGRKTSVWGETRVLAVADDTAGISRERAFELCQELSQALAWADVVAAWAPVNPR